MESTKIPWDLIAQKLERLGKKPAWLAEQLGVGTNVTTNWKTRGGAPQNRAKALATVLRCSTDELLSSFPHSANKATSPNQSAYNPVHNGDNFSAGPDLRSRWYPEISWVQAGMWTEIADNFQLAEDTKKYQCHIDLGPHGFVLRVDGLSMTAPPGVSPSFPPGILLFVRPHEDALPGKFVIVRRNGNTATFKKLTAINGEPYLEALNPNWPEQYIKVHPDDVFCGVVMHAGFDL
ncbi:LexA family protein [Burkholderia cenocepacia]|jgi:SOS-response transcriptional repressor LexA|uniref:LexA family protein n=1 Tax=Burkholderia cenocepacia TaxID=95486 RepID=UPI0013DF1A5E|nr:S24 family peptidase [Burkholderia cenocepacia]DAG84095.1 MAG TPA: SOS-response transcriptional repressors (RecA-mediated autopeptidases) [Caudoviricetes sp.]MCW3586107.1 S24 family peptidase [Burkholderia cenocepacia]MCW3631250.1 S24 family peptidase [Burkholderia cenocepacia]MCW5184457.1 S24 family peptidase [Burkholderia cenocepacia]DAH61470.1 MAG TPA: SOS-response transcriptional repressors (RecA-mediated autopeptidases) [Caudoviricetes sp.]